MAVFDPDTLRDLQDRHEIAIRTQQHPETAVVIWAVVSDGALFVRSARGAKGRWYRDVTADPRAVLEFADRRLAVQAVPVVDASSIEAVSRDYQRKYRNSPYVQSVLGADVLPTTLRLDPV
jgi:hypothetical protein